MTANCSYLKCGFIFCKTVLYTALKIKNLNGVNKIVQIINRIRTFVY